MLAKVIITPRAGNLITQTEKSRIFKSFVKHSFNKIHKKILFTGWVEKEKGIQELFYAAKELINEGLLLS